MYACYLFLFYLHKNSYLGEFEFVHNELYEFLNEKENIDGNIILGMYKHKNIMERGRLKRLLVHKEMRKDLIKYKYELTLSVGHGKNKMKK